MFPRGPRFVPEKIPDIPGPGTYNPTIESTEAYKRGAFLEKANRFDKDKPSEIPGPGTYATEKTIAPKPATHGTKPSGTQGDKYAVLQRKLEHLETVHADSKKAHQTEIERLRLELSRHQKANAEQTEKLDKLNKQNESLDARVQEYKKSNVSQQAEIKDLRVKLRATEHERNQLASKQGDASEAQKALNALETRRKDEVRSRDRTIADLEKSLTLEKKKREAAEAKMQEAKSKIDARIDEARSQVSKLQDELKTAKTESQKKDEALGEAEDEQENLCERLEQTTAMLARVAREYGRLASTTVRLDVHDELKHQHASLQLRSVRLERKLANSEAQVVELANLVRYTKESNSFLSTHIREVEEQAALYSQWLQDTQVGSGAHGDRDSSLEESVASVGSAIKDEQREVDHTITRTEKHFYDLYRQLNQDLLGSLSDAESRLTERCETVQRLKTELSNATDAHERVESELDTLRKEHQTTQKEVARLTTCVEELKASELSAKQELEVKEAQVKAEISKAGQQVVTEKEAAQRLAVALQQAQLAEQALQAEVEQMSVELAQAEQYEEAYNSLLEEVGALLARNQLAEEEAERLSKFNAEIIGHRNPAQRIMYVDRIRRELAETKQKLLMSTREVEVAAADNEDLRNELGMYKSVMVPFENKPRTVITRVGRAPLASQNMNIKSVHGTSVRQTGTVEPKEVEWVREGDMTLDELHM
ncbi:hypothetical protein NEOLEDRAFT_1244068 [Neolentinus lepideus HHB14362 ss-1]|uniref:Hyaluronan-mediated motility receptor C-terminal domain-containing protein n=1 Tax=Neolentinus lepideus HHB14362 ss-1 TaxID=1314782 RepID=A0A165QC52_9AGAM|nr:hypothetical protein NEOLEDRAFT_1244068 [Neolentinus lepideus HHB14362 ss-1]